MWKNNRPSIWFSSVRWGMPVTASVKVRRVSHWALEPMNRVPHSPRRWPTLALVLLRSGRESTCPSTMVIARRLVMAYRTLVSSLYLSEKGCRDKMAGMERRITKIIRVLPKERCPDSRGGKRKSSAIAAASCFPSVPLPFTALPPFPRCRADHCRWTAAERRSLFRRSPPLLAACSANFCPGPEPAGYAPAVGRR